ncbi:glycosyltransferase [Winogradskyella undariae]|uniref:glycosyltransferase n=1 Tax=Winogradskyella undariae TaxID=1285465 RepID=UPI00156B0434|nr:glycosyltransferase [Winogradskyella undariae]NRR91030.1 glycosyltransferase [Winogradskyella undariae]
MKILFTLESFFPTHRAGTEVYVLNLCNYFKAKGHDVSVLITSSEGLKDYSYEGIPIHVFDIPKHAIAEELNGLMPPRGIEAFKVKLLELQPDLIHFHSFGRAINSYHLKEAKALGIRTVFTPHLGSLFCINGDMRLYGKANCNGEVIESRCLSCNLKQKGYSVHLSKILGPIIHKATHFNPIENKLPAAFYQAKHRFSELKRINQYADVIFSIAPWIQKAFEANGVTKAQLIPQGISPVFFKAFHKTQFDPKLIKFVFIGRTHSSKGLHILRDAWNALSNPNAELHIITNPSGGEQTYYDDHKQWAQSKTNIIWNEALKQEEVASYLNGMDVLILPSISNEVAPLVILEAATRKIPVIASDYVAMKDLIQHDMDGLLFKNEDDEDLKNQIYQIIESPNLIGKYSKAIKKTHSMNQVAEIIEVKFKELFNYTK